MSADTKRCAMCGMPPDQDGALAFLGESHANLGYCVLALKSALADVDAACLEVCRDNAPDTVDEVDPEMGRYLCLNENGDELIDTDSPAEVIRRLTRAWALVSEAHERKKDEALVAAREAQHWRETHDATERIANEQCGRLSADVARLDDELRQTRERHALEVRQWEARIAHLSDPLVRAAALRPPAAIFVSPAPSLAGLPIVTDASVRPGVVEVRDDVGSVLAHIAYDGAPAVRCGDCDSCMVGRPCARSVAVEGGTHGA